MRIPAGARRGRETFTLTPVQDETAEGSETVQVRGTATGLTVKAATLTITDDDEPQVSVAPTELTIEEGATGTYTLGLNSQPQRVVTVTVEGATDDVMVSPMELTFTASNWDQGRTVSVMAVNDTVAEGQERVELTHTVNGYGPITTADGVTVTVIDPHVPSTRIDLSVRPFRIWEGAKETLVTVTAALDAGPRSEDTHVRLSVADGTATRGTDYDALRTLLLKIPAGAINGKATFTLTPEDDRLDEHNETVYVTGTVPRSTQLQVNGDTLWLIDNDAAPASSIRAASGSAGTAPVLTIHPGRAAEGSGQMEFRVQPSAPSPMPVSVSYETKDGTATEGEDYTRKSGMLMFAPGMTEQKIVVEINDDLLDEGDEETFTMTLKDVKNAMLPQGASEQQTTGTIEDDDSSSTRIDLSLNPTSVSEDAGATTVTVTATLNAGVQTSDTRVTVSAAGDTATAGTDFTTINDVTLTIQAGNLKGEATFSFEPLQDTMTEGAETVAVSGAVTMGTTLPVTTATLTLRDDETTSRRIDLSLNPSSVSESAGATSVTVKATLDAMARTEETQVTVSVGGGTAESGTDYASVPAVTVTIPTGQLSGTADFTLTPTQDEIAEGPETLEVSGTVTAGTTLPVTAATLTLTDDDTASTSIALNLNPDSVSEDEAATPVTVTATLNDAALTEDTKVTVSVGGGTAESGTDYAPVSAVTVTIAAGAKTGSVDFTLTPMQDDIFEGPETLEVSGTVTAGTTLPVTAATLTLMDDDTASASIALSLHPDSVFEAAADPVGVTVTATLNEGTRTADTQVTVSVAGETATAGTDFTEVDDVTLTIPAEMVSGTAVFLLEPLQDEIVEDAETMEVSGMAVGLTVTPATLTLTDDETASTSIALSLSPNRVSEAAGDTPVAVTATLNEGARASDTEVTVSVSRGSATAGTDYAEVDDITVTIPAGTLSGEEVFTLRPTRDELVEPAETLEFSGMADLTVTAATLTLTEAGETSWSVSADPDLINEDGGGSTLTVSTNDRTFGDDQLITLYLTGSTATPGVDFRLADELTEAGERIVISALHNHAAIGTEWVTIADDETTTHAFGIEPKACNERPVPEQVQINGRKVTIMFSQELGTGTQDPYNDVPYPPYLHFEIHTDSNPNPPDPNPQEPRFVRDDIVEPRLDHYAVAYSREGRRVELTTEAPVTAGESVWVVYHRFGVYAPLFDVGNKNGVCTFITRAENLTAGFIMVANADAQESDGTMDFEVTLHPAASQAPGAVTVEYDTVNGTAIAGEDYVGTNGTLSFEPRESSQTVSVTLIDDSLDDGGETFTLTLRNASTEKGYWITNGEAVGTIYNTDPLPKAWTARFGRAVASHVVDALEARLDASQNYAQIGGHRLGGVADVSRMGWRLAPNRHLWQDGAAEAAGQGMTTQQWLLGSSFHLVANDGQGATDPRVTAWGRLAASGFDGKEGGISLNGMVTTATLGVDGNWKRWLAGVALAYSEGDGTFSQDQDVSSNVTSLHPYVAYAVSNRVRLWGMVGYGDGEFRLNGPQSLSTGLEMTMGAVGVRGTILQPSQPDGGLQLALRSDVMWVGTDTAATTGMTATEAEVSRLRLALEGSRPIHLAQGGSLVPSLEIGLRQDGGDAETGSGVEVGGCLLYAAAWGLSIEASVRGLLAHEASDYQEWGASGALRFAPGQQGRGLTASIVPAWGSSASGISRLWAQADASHLAVDNALATVAAGRLDAELGYGLAAPWGRGLLTPYARVALVEGAEQAWHLGARLALVESLDLSLQAGRRQREGHAAAHELALRAYLGW